MSRASTASAVGSLNDGMQAPLLEKEEEGGLGAGIGARAAVAQVVGPHGGCCGIRGQARHRDVAPRLYRASGRRQFALTGSGSRPGRGGLHVLASQDPHGTFSDWLGSEGLWLGLCVVLGVIGLVLELVPHPPVDASGNKVSRWLFLSTCAVGASVLGRVVDHAVFWLLSAVACTDTVAFVEYFVESFEGLVASAAWVFCTLALTPVLLTLPHTADFWLSHSLYACFVLQGALNLRTLALRAVISSFVRGTFASKIIEVIEFKYVARVLSSPNAWLGRDSEKDSEEWTLLRRPSPSALIGHVNRSSMWIYNHKGQLVECLDDGDVEILSGAAFDRFVSRGRHARVVSIEELDQNAEREPFTGKRVASAKSFRSHPTAHMHSGAISGTQGEKLSDRTRWKFLRRAVSLGRIGAMAEDGPAMRKRTANLSDLLRDRGSHHVRAAIAEAIREEDGVDEEERDTDSGEVQEIGEPKGSWRVGLGGGSGSGGGGGGGAFPSMHHEETEKLIDASDDEEEDDGKHVHLEVEGVEAENLFDSPRGPRGKPKPFKDVVARALNKVDAEGAAKAAAGEEPVLTFEQFSRCFGSDAGHLAVRAWDILETNGDSEISRMEFVAAFRRIFRAWEDVRLSLNGGSSISKVIETIITFLFVMAFLILALLLFDVNLNAVFVPIGSVVLALSFAFADSVSNLTECILFVLWHQPFDVGDRVLVEGISSDEDDVLRVEHVDMLSSVLVRKNGQCIQVPNRSLSEKAITNFRRSRSAFLEYKFKVNYDTSAEKMEELRRAIFSYVKSNTLAWHDEVFVLFERLEVGDDLHVKIILTHSLTWQDYPRLKLAESDFLRHLMHLLNHLGISNYKMLQPVHLTAADGSVGHPSPPATPERKSMPGKKK